MLIGGLLALSANPSRLTNRLFFAFAALAAFAFSCNAIAVFEGKQYYAGNDGDPKPWLRLSATFCHLLLGVLALIKRAIIAPIATWDSRIRGALPWITISAICIAITWTSKYIPTESNPDNKLRGLGYYSVLILAFILFTWLLIQSLFARRKAKGVQRLELSVFILNASITIIFYSFFNLLGNLTDLYYLKIIAVASFPIGFFSSGWLICHKHVFDLRQVSGIVLRWGTTLTASGILGLVTFLIVRYFGISNALLYSIAAVGVLFWPIDRRVSSLIEQGALKPFRAQQTVIDQLASQSIPAPSLKDHYERLLGAYATTNLVTIIVDENRYPDSLPPKPAQSRMNALNGAKWITPESLERLPTDSNGAELLGWLKRRAVGLLVSTASGYSPGIAVAFGPKSGGLPYTYPEAYRLTQLAVQIEAHLTRARLAEQNALKAKMEYLSLMSRGLAHDLKNLLTPVSSFLVHTEGRLEPGSAAHEVHDAALRSMRVMNDYVRDALAFSERLEIRPSSQKPIDVFAPAIKVVEPRAETRNVVLTLGECEDFIFLADPVLTQRLLVNLLANAIDASGEGRKVTLEASILSPGWCSLVVRDEGSGIPAEHLQQIFEPYFSTKQLGDQVRGVGLGLTIADKIARLHGGRIRVHSVVNEGTTMSFDLPLEPPAPAETSAPATTGPAAILT